MINWTTGKLHFWLKSTALVVALVFTWNTVVWADGSGNMVHALQTGNKEMPANTPVTPKDLLSSIKLPEDLGQIKRSHHGLRNELVVHIQDAHVNEEAQRRIAGIIDYFVKEHSARLVNVEGATGELAHHLLSAYPNPKARELVADYFLGEGMISGPEYLALSKRPELILNGVEEKSLYDENRKAFMEALDFKEEDNAVIAKVRKTLEGVARHLLSETLWELVRRQRAFHNEEMELPSYLNYLQELANQTGAKEPRPQIEAFLKLLSFEGELNIEEAEKEVSEVIQALHQNLKGNDLNEFLKMSAGFESKSVSRAEYYKFLSSVFSKLPRGKQYSNFQKYVDYAGLYESIGLELFGEIKRVENAVQEKLFRNEEEKKLANLFELLGIYEKIFNFSLAKDDAEFFYNFHSQFKTSTFVSFLAPLMKRFHFDNDLNGIGLEKLDNDLPKVERFYEIALKRDSILMDRALSEMEQRHQSVSILVTGGFHTPGIERALREKGYSYLVIMPRLTKAIDEAKESKRYAEAMRSEPTKLAKILTETYFPAQSGLANDPRYQLATPSFLPSLSDLAAVEFPVSEEFNPQTFIKAHPQFDKLITAVPLVTVTDIGLKGEVPSKEALYQAMQSHLMPEENKAASALLGIVLGQNAKLMERADGSKLFLGRTWDSDGASLAVSFTPNKNREVSTHKNIQAEFDIDHIHLAMRIVNPTDRLLLADKFTAEQAPILAKIKQKGKAELNHKEMLEKAFQKARIEIAQLDRETQMPISDLNRALIHVEAVFSKMGKLEAAVRSEVRNLGPEDEFAKTIQGNLQELQSRVTTIRERVEKVQSISDIQKQYAVLTEDLLREIERAKSLVSVEFQFMGKPVKERMASLQRSYELVDALSRLLAQRLLAAKKEVKDRGYESDPTVLQLRTEAVQKIESARMVFASQFSEKAKKLESQILQEISGLKPRSLGTRLREWSGVAIPGVSGAAMIVGVIGMIAAMGSTTVILPTMVMTALGLSAASWLLSVAYDNYQKLKESHRKPEALPSPVKPAVPAPAVPAEEREGAERELAGLRAQIKTLEDQLKLIQARYDKEGNNLKALQTEVQQRELEKGQLTQQLNDLRQELTRTQKLNQQAEAEFKSLGQRIQQVQSQIGNAGTLQSGAQTLSEQAGQAQALLQKLEGLIQGDGAKLLELIRKGEIGHLKAVVGDLLKGERGSLTPEMMRDALQQLARLQGRSEVRAGELLGPLPEKDKDLTELEGLFDQLVTKYADDVHFRMTKELQGLLRQLQEGTTPVDFDFSKAAEAIRQTSLKELSEVSGLPIYQDVQKRIEQEVQTQMEKMGLILDIRRTGGALQEELIRLRTDVEADREVNFVPFETRLNQEFSRLRTAVGEKPELLEFLGNIQTPMTNELTQATELHTQMRLERIQKQREALFQSVEALKKDQSGRYSAITAAIQEMKADSPYFKNDQLEGALAKLRQDREQEVGRITKEFLSLADEMGKLVQPVISEGELQELSIGQLYEARKLVLEKLAEITRRMDELKRIALEVLLTPAQIIRAESLGEEITQIVNALSSELQSPEITQVSKEASKSVEVIHQNFIEQFSDRLKQAYQPLQAEVGAMTLKEGSYITDSEMNKKFLQVLEPFQKEMDQFKEPFRVVLVEAAMSVRNQEYQAIQNLYVQTKIGRIPKLEALPAELAPQVAQPITPAVPESKKPEATQPPTTLVPEAPKPEVPQPKAGLFS